MRGSDETTAAGEDATAPSSGEQHATAPSEATAMDEDEVDMECNDDGGGGAGGSSGRLTARVAGVDVDAAAERAARATSATLPKSFEGELAGVKKPRNRSKRPNGKQRQNEAKAKTAGQQRPGARG